MNPSSTEQAMLRDDRARAANLELQARSMGAEDELRALTKIGAELGAIPDAGLESELHRELDDIEGRIDRLKLVAVAHLHAAVERTRARVEGLQIRSTRLRSDARHDAVRAAEALKQRVEALAGKVHEVRAHPREQFVERRWELEQEWREIESTADAYDASLRSIARSSLGEPILGLSENWWALVLSGVLSMFFGLWMVVRPGIAALSFMVGFALYAIVYGILEVVAAARAGARREGWLGLLAVGIVSIVAGGIAFAQPFIAGLSLVRLVAAWAITIGVLAVVAAVKLRRAIDDEWALGLEGALAIVFGIGIATFPLAGALTLATLFGLFVLTAGLMRTALGLRMRTIHRKVARARAV